MSELDRPPEPRPGRRRSDPHPLVRPMRWFGLGLGVAVLVGLGILLLFSQTRWGRAQVLAFTLEAIGGRINGEFVAERLSGNLITGARLHEIALRDPDGVPLVEADSAFIRYRLATLLGGDILIHRLDAFGARVNLFRLPEDTLWNYQVVLTDTVVPEHPTATLVERLRLHRAHITIRFPWEPDPRLAPAEQQLQIQEVLRDTSRLMVEALPTGYLRTAFLEIEEGAISELFVGPDERGGTYFQVSEAQGEVWLWRDPPLELRHLVGELHLREGIVQYVASEILLPASQGQSSGTVDLRGDRPLYDVVVESPHFTLPDLRWLYPWFPEQGEGSIRLWVEDRPEGLLVLARELLLTMPGTRLTGSFGLVFNEVLRFTDVELEADPLEVHEVESLFPGDLPVEGLEIGGAVIEGV